MREAGGTNLGAVTVDLNADLGESYGQWTLGDDDAMLGLVSSANVACGFHAGDPSTLRATTARAAEAGVVIGAQVSYPDLRGFGRRFVDVEPSALTDDVLYQIGALEALSRVAGSRVRYVKPHGALYNATRTHTAQARAVAEAVRAYDPSLPVLGLPGSELLRAAEEAGLRAVPEFFVDRGYTPEGGLVPRREPGALLSDAGEAADRLVRMLDEGVVRAVDGTDVAVRAESACVHGDSPGAVAMAERVRDALARAGVGIRAFAP
ncbi:Lactam utilization protein LamB [Pseudonocardia sp. Ae707_Ps1]|nr:Lactam utilization protein LamB [Pseudonocardia sp. Ae707_Ps1]